MWVDDDGDVRAGGHAVWAEATASDQALNTVAVGIYKARCRHCTPGCGLPTGRFPGLWRMLGTGKESACDDRGDDGDVGTAMAALVEAGARGARDVVAEDGTVRVQARAHVGKPRYEAHGDDRGGRTF